jgi:hypothetical protein
MKKCISLILVGVLLLSLCACQGNFGKVNLQNTMMIPEDGIVSREVIQKILQENAIAVFQGSSGSYSYEWTIFGSDITQAKDINLAAQIEQNEDGAVTVSLPQEESFGFSGLLSIHLPESWSAQSATAYVQDQAVASVSLTGREHTILNLSLDGTHSKVTVRPDKAFEDTEVQLSGKPDEYLSDMTGSDDKVYSDTPQIPAESGSDDYLSNGTGSDDQVYTGDADAPAPVTPAPQNPGDNYLTDGKGSDDQVYTDGKDKYLTDPVPEGKPTPVEPEDQQVDKGTSYTCTFSIECSTILNNLDMLDPDKLEMVPSGGVILSKTTVTFYEGESVFDVLQRVCREKGIHMEAEWTPIYNSAYIEGIHNLYEFDCGALSGWMYKVNGWYPNYGCSRYQLEDGDVVEWRFTCDLGSDIGGGYAVGG